MRSSLLTPEIGRAFYGAFQKLNPAQRDAVEPLLEGTDVLVLAGTGSGKTEAVVAPLVQRWLPEIRRDGGCRILYVTPTRALANDLLRRLEPPLESLGVVVGVRHGERNDLNRAEQPHVLITTPESLDVLLTTRDIALRTVQGVVVDEVHLTYNTQRGFQLAILLKRLERLTQHACQVIGLSATVANPADIWQFFRPGHEVVTIVQPQNKPLDVHIREVPSDQALVNLVDRIGAGSRVKILLFANARRECDRLGAALRRNTDLADNVFVHHSSLDREIRCAAERHFQDAARAVCVATSTLELGIDIGDIDLVILYGHPGGWESFLQRVGRGNRRAEKTNVACLVSPDHGSTFRSMLAFEALLAQIRAGRMERERPLHVYGAAVQQILSFILEHQGTYVRLADLTDLFTGWPHLEADMVEAIVRELAQAGHLLPHDFQNRYGAGEQLYRLRDLRMIWGNFPVRSRDVQLRAGNREIGRIPATNLLRITAGTILRFGGAHWRVRRVLPDFVDVEPTRSASGLEVSYGGSALPLDPTIAEEMLRLIEEGEDHFAIADGSGALFSSTLLRLRSHVASQRLCVTRDAEGRFYHFTFAGRILNGVIARWAGLSDFDAGDLVLRTERGLDLSHLPTDPRDLQSFAELASPPPEDLTIFQSLLPPDLLAREHRDAWLKTPVHRRSLERLRQANALEVPFSELASLCDRL